MSPLLAGPGRKSAKRREAFGVEKKSRQIRYDPPDHGANYDEDSGEEDEAAVGVVATESNKRRARHERPNNKVKTFRFGQHHCVAPMAHPRRFAITAIAYWLQCFRSTTMRC